MNWKLLSKNQCPKCRAPLDFGSDETMMMCTISCGFMISSRKMSAICASQAARELLKSNPVGSDNQASLEELGRTNNPFILEPKEQE